MTAAAPTTDTRADAARPAPRRPARDPLPRGARPARHRRRRRPRPGRSAARPARPGRGAAARTRARPTCRVAVTGHGTLSAAGAARSPPNWPGTGCCCAPGCPRSTRTSSTSADPGSELYAADPDLVLCLLDPMVVFDEVPAPWRPADVERVLAAKLELLDRLAETLPGDRPRHAGAQHAAAARAAHRPAGRPAVPGRAGRGVAGGERPAAAAGRATTPRWSCSTSTR